MPIPKPHADESKNDFMSRCMTVLNSDYPDESQRAAICYTSWDEKDAKSMAEEKSAMIYNFSADIKALQESEGDFEATITTQDIDRDGDVVIADGINAKDYMKNPVIMWGHDYSLPPVAKCVGLVRLYDRLVAKGVFAKRPENHEGPWLPDILKSLIEQKILHGVSIGFQKVDDRRPTEKDKAVFGQATSRIISKSNLLEFSLVSIPCNQNALIDGLKSLGVSGDYAKKSFGIDYNKIETENKNHLIIESKDVLVTEGDEKVCPQCGKLDGMEFDPANSPIPVHPNCRCKLVSGKFVTSVECKEIEHKHDGKAVGDSGQSGETNSHTHTIIVGHNETSIVNGHSHMVLPGSDKTEESEEHTHTIPSELIYEQPNDNPDVIQAPVELIQPKRCIIEIDAPIDQDKIKTLVKIELAKKQGKLFL